MEHRADVTLVGMDNLSRAGAEGNRAILRELGVRVIHGDIRSPSDIDQLPPADWVIDCAANPSVLAGMDGSSNPRQLLENNLLGTVNLLEYCRVQHAAFTLISTSRVYNIDRLASLRLEVADEAYIPVTDQPFPAGISVKGVTEEFSTEPPVSLYGVSKSSSELLALEYGLAFGFPVWINRCGVLAGAGQFARPDQGIAAFWLHSWQSRRKLRYIGFEGKGRQVRDIFHPKDLTQVLLRQVKAGDQKGIPRLCNFGGGIQNAISLAQLSAWCRKRFFDHPVIPAAENRPFDIPWFVMDNARASAVWEWQPQTSLHQILEEIANFAEKNPDWLSRTI
jgi:CDP-paratose 2-epimerase